MRVLTDSELEEMKGIRWWHKFQVGTYADGSPVITPGICDNGDPEQRFGISPHLLKGKTVLDIGTWDGATAFWAEQHGGIVTGWDCDQAHGGNWAGPAGFNFAKRVLGSKVQWEDRDIQEPVPDLQWDVVICTGVVYHLRNPFACLKNLRKLTRVCLFIESAMAQEVDGSAHWELDHGWAKDVTNYFFPTRSGLIKTMNLFGFSSVKLVASLGRTEKGRRESFGCI